MEKRDIEILNNLLKSLKKDRSEAKRLADLERENQREKGINPNPLNNFDGQATGLEFAIDRLTNSIDLIMAYNKAIGKL
jgi:hypothetical protein